MAFLVRDWWPEGEKYITWRVDSVKTAYSEYSGVSPSSASDFLGSLVVIRELSSTSTGASSASIPESSIWSVPEGRPEDLAVEYGIEGHTGAWGLAVAAESDGVEPILDHGALIMDQGEVYVGMLNDINSGILSLSMLEVFPSTRSMPDLYWELSGDDLYLTGAIQ